MRTLLVILFTAFLLNVNGQSAVSTSADKEIFAALTQKAQADHITKQEINKIIVWTGKQFLGKPYVAHTLENTEKEELVVNLRELDCTTFVETVVALSITFHQQQTRFEDFCQHLMELRYRHKRIDGYPSRLHYFTDWIYENEQKGLVKDISRAVSDTPYLKQINFMSENIKEYPSLQNNPGFVKAIKETEAAMNQRPKYFVPTTAIPINAGAIEAGDIIAFTPALKNLDITHVGFAVEIDGKIHFMHASLSGKKVIITEESLHDYLKDSKRNTGIMVIRVNN